MECHHVTKLECDSPTSIFLAMTDGTDGIMRQRYDRAVLSKVEIDIERKEVRTVQRDWGRGEDPRSFIWRDRIWIHDNTNNKGCIFRLDDHSKTIGLPPIGKNFFFFTADETLYFISWLIPLQIYRWCDKRKEWHTHPYFDRTAFLVTHRNRELRGGIPLLRIDDSFVGLGKRTYALQRGGSEQTLMHRPFYFIYDHEQSEVLRIDQLQCESFRNCIIDPTSAWFDHDSSEVYFITAESDKPWFERHSPILETNIYRFHLDAEAIARLRP